jgi:hypothetical protein
MIIHAVKIFNLMKTNHLLSKFKNNKLKMKIKFLQNIAFMEFWIIFNFRFLILIKI